MQPARFKTEPNFPGSDKKWKHWKSTFENFLLAVADKNPDKLKTLINYVEPEVYDYISECTNYETALATLESIYIKPKNEIYSRHVLSTRVQQEGETLDQYLQTLNLMAKECDFKAVNASQNRDDYVRDSFINGISSKY